MKLEQTITIMGGKHTLPRCQHYKDKQCGKSAQKNAKYCAHHQNYQSVGKESLLGVDIDAAHRKAAWWLMVERAIANVESWHANQYRNQHRPKTYNF